MTADRWLSLAGVVLAMSGTAFAFFVGFPQPDHRGHGLLLESSPSQEELDQAKRRRRNLSYVGLSLLGLGGALQLLGIVLAPT